MTTKKAGFTLTEIIVSVLLLAVIGAGIFGAFTGGQTFVVLTKHRIEAFNFARKAMEILKERYNYTELGPPVPDIGGVLQGEMAGIGSLTYGTETESSGTETEPWRCKKITVKVNWSEPKL